jgi:endonuclease/exonuclease/phosphatase family metal-dependent hydrolase
MESKRLIVVLGESSRIRCKQVDIVARYIQDHAQYPIILCGDFNDSPISHTHHTLTKGLTDCFVATGNGPGWTYTNSRMYVRIDNILCSSHFTPYKCIVDKNATGSDHYPVTCWLKNTSK